MMADNSRDIDLRAQRDTSAHLLNDYRKNEEYTDVKLQIGDKLFPAHRNILSLHSPVLKAAISEQWSATGICPISGEYVDPEIVEDLLSFLYTGSIKLTPDNVHPVCMAAHFLQIPTLLEPSVELLCELITLENVLKLFLFSFSCQLDVLRSSCLQFIISNYGNVLEHFEILELGFENFKTIIVGLKSGSWQPMLRKHIFDAIVRWTEKNVSERLEHLPILLENIPLDALPTKFLKETVSTHRLVKNCLSFSTTFSKVLSDNELKANESFIVIGGYKGDRTYSTSMFSFDFETGMWDQIPDISEQKAFFAATVINGRNIIISGGKTSIYPKSTKTDKVEMFDWSTQTWLDMPPMPLKLAKHPMAVLNGILYVAGLIREYKKYHANGMFTDQETRIMCYSFELKQWSDVKMPNSSGINSQLIPYKDHLYAIGADHFEKYNPAQNQWTVLKPPKTIYPHFAATLHQDKFYLCSHEDFKVYDPETNDWTSLPAPAVGWSTSLLSVKDKLLVVGGLLVSDRSATDLIYEFDLRTNKWNEFGKLPLKLGHHQCLVGQFR